MLIPRCTKRRRLPLGRRQPRLFSDGAVRLVNDNGYSLEYAAHRRPRGRKEAGDSGHGVDLDEHVRLREDRDWLTVDEAAQLRQLIADFQRVRDTLPWRVIHGLNIGEDAVHMRIIQRSLLLIATASKVSYRRKRTVSPVSSASACHARCRSWSGRHRRRLRARALHGEVSGGAWSAVGMFQVALRPRLEPANRDSRR